MPHKLAVVENLQEEEEQERRGKIGNNPLLEHQDLDSTMYRRMTMLLPEVPMHHQRQRDFGIEVL